MTTPDLVERFAERFVHRDRRDRVKLLLCSDKPARRRQGIEAVERWLESYEEVSGSGATQTDKLRKLGDHPGVLISERNVGPMTLLEAYNESSSSFDALFLSTDGALAALFLEVAGPRSVALQRAAHDGALPRLFASPHPERVGPMRAVSARRG